MKIPRNPPIALVKTAVIEKALSPHKRGIYPPTIEPIIIPTITALPI